MGASASRKAKDSKEEAERRIESMLVMTVEPYSRMFAPVMVALIESLESFDLNFRDSNL